MYFNVLHIQNKSYEYKQRFCYFSISFLHVVILIRLWKQINIDRKIILISPNGGCFSEYNVHVVAFPFFGERGRFTFTIDLRSGRCDAVSLFLSNGSHLNYCSGCLSTCTKNGGEGGWYIKEKQADRQKS